MKENPFVTLIIPTLNEEEYIGQCLLSAHSQSYPENLTEILIVDGGSTDKTIDIVKRDQCAFKNVYILENTKKIQASAFNLGVINSRGDIIIRWDAHCIYDKDYIHYCVLDHIGGIYGNAGGSIQVMPGSETLMGKNIALINSSPFGLGGAAFRSKPVRGYVDTVPFGSFRKEVIAEIGPMNEKLPRGEDNEYNTRIRKAGYKILLDPLIRSYYFARKDLNSFIRQMYINGFSVGVLIRLSPSFIRIRHIIPLLFLMFIMASSVLSIFFPPVFVAFICVIALYFLLDLIFAFKICSKGDIELLPVMFFSVFLIHLSYGLGTMHGLWQGRFMNE